MTPLARKEKGRSDITALPGPDVTPNPPISAVDLTAALADGGCGWHGDWREPAVAVGLFAAGDREELFLNTLGDGAARACADLNAINRANWRDFGGSSREENFVGDVKHFAG